MHLATIIAKTLHLCKCRKHKNGVTNGRVPWLALKQRCMDNVWLPTNANTKTLSCVWQQKKNACRSLRSIITAARFVTTIDSFFLARGLFANFRFRQSHSLSLPSSIHRVAMVITSPQVLRIRAQDRPRTSQAAWRSPGDINLPMPDLRLKL
jgi:hypothetical protein